MKPRSRKWMFFLGVATALATGLSGCGNSWFSHKARDGVASELYRDGKLAADNLDYDTAIKKFSQSLALDTNNDDTRLRLAYSYNGKASLGPLEIYKNVEASKTAALNASSGGLTEVAKLVGFDADAKQAFLEKLQSTTEREIGVVRGFSDRLTVIHDGWKTVCRLLPESVITNLVTSDANISRVMSGTHCRAGLPDEKSGSSAAFAGMLQLLTEAIYLYQTILDVNDDGQIDFVVEATKVNNDIKSVQTSIATATGSSITTLMTTLNSSLASLKKIGDTFRSDPVLVAITDFAIVAQLAGSVAGIPDDLKTQLTQSSGKLADAKNIIDSFSSTAASSSGGSSSGASASAAAASKAMEDLSAKMDTLSGAEREQAQQQLDQACTQFDSVKSVYGLPADTQKPASCQ